MGFVTERHQSRFTMHRLAHGAQFPGVLWKGRVLYPCCLPSVCSLQ